MKSLLARSRFWFFFFFTIAETDTKSSELIQNLAKEKSSSYLTISADLSRDVSYDIMTTRIQNTKKNPVHPISPISTKKVTIFYKTKSIFIGGLSALSMSSKKCMSLLQMEGHFTGSWSPRAPKSSGKLSQELISTTLEHVSVWGSTNFHLDKYCISFENQ